MNEDIDIDVVDEVIVEQLPDYRHEICKTCGMCHPDKAKEFANECKETLNPAFPFPVMNPLQRRLVEAIDNGKSILAVAETGTGKTAIIPYIAENGYRIAYVSPLKELSRETGEKLQALGHSVGFIYGEAEFEDKYRHYVFSYEKFESVIRKQDIDVDYVIYDEIHEIAQPERGPIIDLALTRILKSTDKKVILLSATMDNDDIYEWLKKYRDAELIRTDFSPIKRDIAIDTIYSYKSFVDYVINEITNSPYHDNIAVLVYSRKMVKQIANELNSRGINANYHSAELSLDDRKKIIDEFKNGGVIVATPTIAAGVNLPIKRMILLAVYYDGAGLRVLPKSSIMQIVGRAGRAPYFTSCRVDIVVPADYEETLYRELDKKIIVKPKHSGYEILACIKHGELELARDLYATFVGDNYEDTMNYLIETRYITRKHSLTNKGLQAYNLMLEPEPTQKALAVLASAIEKFEVGRNKNITLIEYVDIIAQICEQYGIQYVEERLENALTYKYISVDLYDISSTITRFTEFVRRTQRLTSKDMKILRDLDAVSKGIFPKVYDYLRGRVRKDKLITRESIIATLGDVEIPDLPMSKLQAWMLSRLIEAYHRKREEAIRKSTKKRRR